MNEKVTAVLNKISESGYKPIEELTKDYQSLVEKSKVVHPHLTEEPRDAYVLNILMGRSKVSSVKTISVKGYLIGASSEFDQNKKERDKSLREGYINEDNQPIFKGMPDNRKFLEDQPIPVADDSMTRPMYFVGTMEDKEDWKPTMIWLRNSKGIVPPQNKLINLKVSGKMDAVNPSLSMDGSSAAKILDEAKIDFGGMITSMLPDNICKFEEIESFEQPQGYPLTIFRGVVVSAKIVEKAGVKSNPVEIRMAAETVEDIIKADDVENRVLWFNKSIPVAELNEGDTGWFVANKFVKQSGDISLQGMGFFIETTGFPKEAPVPLTEENTKTTNGNGKVWEGDNDKRTGVEQKD